MQSQAHLNEPQGIIKKLPDATGHFGQFGGRYVPETLMPALLELEDAYMKLKDNSDFQQEFQYYLREYVGRPNPLYYADHLTETLGGAKIYLKREDLNHTGAHKINSASRSNLACTMDGQKTYQSLKRVPDNTVSQQPPSPPSSVWNVRFIWERKT